MNAMKTLNMKPTKKTVKVASVTIERELNAFMSKAIKTAFLKSEKYNKYFVEDMPETDIFILDDVKGEQVKEIRTIKGDVIAIPQENVTLRNGENICKLDTAFKIGNHSTYIKGISKQYAEYIKTKK